MALVSPRQAFRGRPGVPEDWEPHEREHRRLIANTVNDALRGKQNNTGSVTLTVSSATTVVKNPLVEAGSHIVLSPLTASAAAESWYISARTARASFEITHANSAVSDRSFTYAITS